ncbi:hypothetical protein [Parapedobacter koreensis]|uniref:Uncharacterized protein n=1 Tax=Parapedobacter koreensis TaxID=332977 RepID=A0A1H7ISR2_9SPHI|nr:hypothetical protein [Parapedobacter koreensis]SEK63815.1 hypothetical protein SAMN05421740_102300 [Parapedobacter koreensis]
MKETVEFRIFKDYYHLLSKPNNAKYNGVVYVIEVEKEDPLYNEIGRLNKSVKEKYSEYFFGYYSIKRKYSKKELEGATLLHLKIKTTFEPAGEECGTMYDEVTACAICGANRKQINPLTLMKGSVPKKDIARTIAGEVVVSEKFAAAFKQRGLKGALLEPVVFKKGASNYYQLIASTEIELSHHTVVGGDPFDLGIEGGEALEFTVSGGYPVEFEKEVYKCPKGHTIGLNLLSEPYVLNSQLIGEYDFFASKQKIGVKRGLLRPEPIYFCSQAFRKMIEEEKLSGFEFEITHIE